MVGTRKWKGESAMAAETLKEPELTVKLKRSRKQRAKGDATPLITSAVQAVDQQGGEKTEKIRRKKGITSKENGDLELSETITKSVRKRKHPAESSEVKAPKRGKRNRIKGEQSEQDTVLTSPYLETPGHEKPVPLKSEPSESAEVVLQKLSAISKQSDIDSDESEETEAGAKKALASVVNHERNEDEDDDLFEDVALTRSKILASSKFDLDDDVNVNESDNLELTLEKTERLQLSKTGKKKQSVRAVHERCFAHYMSLITMVAIGAWRNMWITDSRLQAIIRQHLKRRSPTLHRELSFAARSTTSNSHEFIELIGRVMKRFSTMFIRTKPGLRKLGYRLVSQMDAAKDYEDASERFADIDEYLEQAEKLQGSRDFGAQLFTALLRAYHFRTRLIFSTQPLGFKFNTREEFNSELLKGLPRSAPQTKTEPKLSSAAAKPVSESQALNKTIEPAGGGTIYNHEPRRDSSRAVKTRTKDDAISLDDSDLSDLDSDDLDSDVNILDDLEKLESRRAKSKLLTKADRDTTASIFEDVPDAALEYPIYWTELFNPYDKCWMAVDAMVKKVVLVDEKGFKSLQPRGHKAEQQKLTLGYVVAYDANRRAKDVTTRYASSWAKVREVCLRADGKTNTRYDANLILSKVGNPYRDALERAEDDSLAFKEVKLPPPDAMPTTLAEFKASPKYLLEHQLREKEAFRPGAKPITTVNVGKGSKTTDSKVYLRTDVIPCKTIENYHKEGRQVKTGEQPRKMIKARAMTTNRIREHQQQMAETGEDHILQGIYSIDQTEYIIPPPIKDGIIPKNAYGNADVFVESMIPKGATHLKLKGVARIARKLEMNHAEAVVGFEFKKRGAIPLILGVLVADENAAELEAAWHEAEEIRIRKKDKKRTEAALRLWVKLLKGLRIRKRINAEYGIPDEVDNGIMNVTEPAPQKTLQEQVELRKKEVMDVGKGTGEDDYPAGGFVRE